MPVFYVKCSHITDVHGVRAEMSGKVQSEPWTLHREACRAEVSRQ